MIIRPVSFLFVLVTLWPWLLPAAALPSGFIESEVSGYWSGAVGIVFDEVGTMYQWDRDGLVWVYENDVRLPEPLIDLREEVGSWRDHGMLGFTLHPDFRQNGHIYLMYVVDHHHLAHYGTVRYRPSADEYFQATIGRITRYTARASDGFRTVDPASRTVLVGESASTGFPIPSGTHGVGSLVFGTDGTLLASCGDGAGTSDAGSDPLTYFQEALAEGIIQPKENIGAFRSQMVDSLSGKILRIDPATGDGITNNPFYDPVNPRAARSRIWALGFRQPFRMSVKPGSGSHYRADGRPGIIYVGEVGEYIWEELNVVTGPGQNFGWPIFEGLTRSETFADTDHPNQDAINPLYNGEGCTQEYFTFRDLFKEATLGTPSWPNPCDSTQQVPAAIPHFVHARPMIDWMHGSGPARTGTFDGTNAAIIDIDASGSPISGEQFGGNCAIGGAWYGGNSFPEEYKGTYFLADLGNGWIRNIKVGAGNLPVEVRDFAGGIEEIVSLAVHPISGALYHVMLSSGVYKISYGGNAPPKAVAAADVSYGPAPLRVQFTGGASTDPEGLPLTYAWDFGDGSPISTAADPVHVFDAPSGIPKRYDVTLTVTDEDDATNATRLVISVNNTPPSVAIVSPPAGTRYSLKRQTVYDLTPTVADSEHATNEMSAVWRTDLHHNTHIHPGQADTNWISTTVISPIGCDSETYYYRVSLTVTDAAGLSGRAFVDLHPACSNVPPAISSVTVDGGQIKLVVSGDSGPDYIIETSPDLSAWTELFRTNSPPMPFTCILSNQPPCRFFRVLLEP